MTGRSRIAMRSNASNARAGAGTRSRQALLALALAVLLVVGSALAEEGEQVVSRTTHFIDSSSDRTPAKTSFPTYPKIARRDRIEGDATVCFRVDIDGRVKGAKVQNYTHRIFRRPALRAMKESSFEPLKPTETFSTARSCRTYRFRLEPILADNDEPSGR